MTNIDKKVKGRYVAPLSDTFEALEDVMICESGTADDWVYDEDDLTF
ncbi:MAG: hypothetical protein J6W82_02445 [Bacteroidales bacterium]|nr:hypothetical protein [Bacteroidales bacterium]